MKAVLIFLVFIVVTSCQNHSGEPAAVRADTNTAKHPNSTTSTRTTPPAIIFTDFAEFWKVFRTAVLDSDTNQIISMTEFPFQTRGPLDDDPDIEYEKQKFAAVFKAYLHQWDGGSLEGTSELDGIRKTETPDKKEIKNNYVRMGDLVFNKTDKGWKLVFAYLNDDTIELLGK